MTAEAMGFRRVRDMHVAEKRGKTPQERAPPKGVAATPSERKSLQRGNDGQSHNVSGDGPWSAKTTDLIARWNEGLDHATMSRLAMGWEREAPPKGTATILKRKGRTGEGQLDFPARPDQTRHSGDRSHCPPAGEQVPIRPTRFRDVRSLSGSLVRLNLGASPIAAAWPISTFETSLGVPATWEPAISRATMRELLIPEWEFERQMGFPDALERVRPPTAPVRGLYWFERGTRVGVLQWAIITLYSFADILAGIPFAGELCGATPNAIRSYLKDDLIALPLGIVSGPEREHCGSWRMTMSVDATGKPAFSRVATFGSQRQNAYHSRQFDRIAFCDRSVKFLGGVADYHLWWAHRLLDYGLRCLSVPHVELARLSAKVAMAQVVRIAGLLLHEILHDPESFVGFEHCTGVDCCPDLTEQAFQAFMQAELGLPPDRDSFQVAVASDGQTFNPFAWFRAVGPWHLTSSQCVPIHQTDPTSEFTVHHCSLLQPDHRMQLRWSIPARCRSTLARSLGLASGTVRREGEADGLCLFPALKPADP